MRSFVVAAAVLFCASPAAASSGETAEALETLRAGDRLPASRADAIEALADPTNPLTPAQLDDLLALGAPWSAHIDAAQVASRRMGPALAAAMFRGFIGSKAGRVEHDPDVFEVLLRALQRFPPDVAAAAFAGADASAVTTHAADRLAFHWLNPLDVEFDEEPDPEGWIEAAVDRRTRLRLAGLAAQGEHGLVTLQSDSGDVGFHLVEDAELIVLVGHLLASGEDKLEYAQAVCSQRSMGREQVQAAIDALRSVGRPFSEAENALAARFLRLLPTGLRNEFVPDRVSPVRGSVEAEPWEASPLAPSRLRGLAPERVAAGLYGLLWFGFVGAFGRRKAWRRVVFPAAAVGLVPLLFGVVELGLGVAGVEPLGVVRPTFNPTNAPQAHFEDLTLESVEHQVTVSGKTRFAALPARKGENELRVVALGASSVHGSNYLREEAWPEVLGRRLTAQLPEHTVRVVNLGTGGAVSDEVFFHAREAIERLQPDLLVVSLGYNDFTHLRDLSAYRAYDPNDLRLRFELDRWRIVRVLTAVLPRIALPVEPRGAFLDPTEMSPVDVAAVQRVAERSVQSNLERITAMAASARVEVLFLLQGQNEELCGSGAVLGSRLDRCFPPALRGAVLRAASRDGVPVVDSAAALLAHAGEEPVGFQYYWDRIHASRLGHAVLGEAIAPAALDLLRARP